MSDFTVVDRRGMRRSAASSNFYVGDPNTEMRRLRQAGYTLPKSPVQARIEAKRVADTATRTSLTEATNRSIMSEMRRNRMASGMRRTGSNVQMAMPKVREPFASLEDRGIPYDTQDLRDLSTIRRWCRLWYTTHDLVPLLIDIYSKFPVVGLEFRSTDKKIQEFYEQMFMDDLNYGEFLSEGLGREFFTVGEVTSLAHFNESLGIWSSEEVLNPEMIRVSKSLFVQQERIQLMVKELVENLRSGPSGGGDAEETPSERLERTHEYCCTPKTKVLTADLQWVPVDSLKVGDPIMGFDEYPRPGKGNKRQWVPTRVTATKSIAGNTYRVVTDGPSVECTDQHRWLAVPQNRNETLPIDTTQDEEFYPTYDWRGKEIARSKPWILRPCNHCGIPMELRPSAAAVTKFCSKRCSNSVKNRQYSSGLNSGQLMWVRTDELRPGDKIMHLGLWDVEDNRDTGWMGGFLDGEGTLGKTGITFSQNVGPVLDRALSILGQYKFDYSYHELAPHQKSGKVCAHVRIKGGQSELLRALSIFRPVRLLERLADWINGAQIAGDWVTVTEVTHLGSQEVIALATSSKTLIAEGMFSHNTQLLKHYPEVIKAAAQDDGLDISDALVSRLVNKAAPWDLRGTPHLLRSFRTLMMEESLNQAQNAVCFPAGTPVLTSTGAKLIEDVTADDEVLTHRGRYRSVVRTMRRDADDAGVTIRWWYDRPMTLTAEHPVYIRRKAVHRGICAVCRRSTDKPHRIVCDDHVASRVEPSGRLQRAVCCLCGAKANAPKSNHCDLHDPDNQSYVEGFIPASEVSVYDQVLHPDSPDSGREYISIWEHLSPSDWVVYDPTDTAWGFSGHDWYDSAATQTKRVAKNRAKKVIDAVRANPGDILRHSRLNAKTSHFRAEYKLTEDLLWLVGLHVADGSAMINNSSGTPHGSVVITLGEHETDIADRAAQVFTDVFGVTPTITPCRGTKAIKVSANSLALAMWFREMCGVKGTKRFPSWAFGLTAPQTAALIRGWMDGDGHTNDVRTQGSTAYRHLQESAAWLMRRAGKITSTFRTEGTGFGVRHHQYVVTTVKTPRRAYPADQGGYWVEVRSVDHHQVTGLVYNLEVDEDNSYCTPIAVHNCDRLYAPLILATMGIENMGDGEPWIPDQGELDDLRDDMQNALAADFKLLVHNFGVNVQSVFGRESVPRFDSDYDRIDAKLLQAWGIGQALIAGGSGAGGAYASSALNREVCEQLMLTFQKKVLRHMRKRAEVIAEAQEHYDYELKGGVRVPIYREIVQFNEETGEDEIVRVPKLLIPEIEFDTLNLRDEAQERQFIAQLKEMGVPVSDGTLAVNIPIKFREELEKQAEETVSKGLAKAQAMKKLQAECDAQGLPYPDDLVASLSATLQLRQGLAQTEMVEGQADMQEQQIKQMQAPAAASMGLIPGLAPPPPPEEGQQKTAASGPDADGPTASGPGGVEHGGEEVGLVELPRNRQRPVESDEQRASMPKRLSRGPSSYGQAKKVPLNRVERAIRRRASGVTVDDLVHDPETYAITNMEAYESQIVADWPEILAGGAPDSRKLLEELLEQYEEVMGVQPRW